MLNPHSVKENLQAFNSHHYRFVCNDLITKTDLIHQLIGLHLILEIKTLLVSSENSLSGKNFPDDRHGRNVRTSDTKPGRPTPTRDILAARRLPHPHQDTVSPPCKHEGLIMSINGSTEPEIKRREKRGKKQQRRLQSEAFEQSPQ